MTIATGDSVLVEYTGRLEDGSVFDTSRESVAAEAGLKEKQPSRDFEPLSVELGTGRIIEGFEEALIGMDEGEETTVEIPPEKAYGERNADRVAEYDPETFTEMLGEQPTEGIRVETEDRGRGLVTHVGSEVVRVDFNHALAGEQLEFDIEVLEVE